MTLQEPKNPIPADAEVLDTEVIVVAQPSPVFVDSTGRRRRVLRRVAYGFGALCMVYGGLISVSLAGGPVSSSAVLPLPDLADNDDTDPLIANPSTTPQPVTATPSSRPVLESLPRQAAPPVRKTVTARQPARSTASARRSTSAKPSSKATKKPTPTPTTSRTVESTPTKATTPATTPPTVSPSIPIAPAPPGTNTGGTGGGVTTDGAGEDTDTSGSGGGNEAPSEEEGGTADSETTADQVSEPEEDAAEEKAEASA